MFPFEFLEFCSELCYFLFEFSVTKFLFIYVLEMNTEYYHIPLGIGINVKVPFSLIYYHMIVIGEFIINKDEY